VHRQKRADLFVRRGLPPASPRASREPLASRQSRVNGSSRGIPPKRNSLPAVYRPVSGHNLSKCPAAGRVHPPASLLAPSLTPTLLPSCRRPRRARARPSLCLMQSIRVHLDRGIVKAQGRHAAIGKLYVARRADRRVYLEMTLAARSHRRRRLPPSPPHLNPSPETFPEPDEDRRGTGRTDGGGDPADDKARGD